MGAWQLPARNIPAVKTSQPASIWGAPQAEPRQHRSGIFKRSMKVLSAGVHACPQAQPDQQVSQAPRSEARLSFTNTEMA
jgi:hypothetical protein